MAAIHYLLQKQAAAAHFLGKEGYLYSVLRCGLLYGLAALRVAKVAGCADRYTIR
jgi:hypothetical protein